MRHYWVFALVVTGALMVSVALLPLLSKVMRIEQLRLRQAEMSIETDAAGRSNLDFAPADKTGRTDSGGGFRLTAIREAIIEDGRLNRRMPDQPYNLALITLDEDPTVNFYSNLPGTPPYEVPVGAAVEVVFEEVAPGQLIHEWRVID